MRNNEKPCALLDQHLKMLEKYLKVGGADVMNICINRPGEICIESKEDGWKIIKDKEVTTERLRMLFEVLATTSRQKFTEEYPILATHLEFNGIRYRCHVLNDTLTYDGISVSIRKGAVEKYPIESYFAPIPGYTKPQDMLDDDEDPYADIVKELRPLLAENRQAEAVKLLMEAGGAVVICGGTSSGKTSFVNSMIDMVPMTERIITVEDTHELQLPHRNKVHIVTSKTGSGISKFSYSDIIDSGNRMRPDRIFYGELDVPNTMAFLRTINTGHKGAMGTLHANNPKAVVGALVMNMQLAGVPAEDAKIEKYLRGKITAFVSSRCIVFNGKSYFRAEVELPK